MRDYCEELVNRMLRGVCELTPDPVVQRGQIAIHVRKVATTAEQTRIRARFPTAPIWFKG